MKNIQNWEQFNEKKLSDITYDEAIKLGDLERIVKKHIKDNYPEFYYGKDNILGPFGKDIPTPSWKKLSKLAKDKKDDELKKAIENYMEKEKETFDKHSELK